MDIEGIRVVINYDCPKTIEVYVHRAGRTGRAGKKGTSVTLLTSADEPIFYDLVTYLKANNQSIPIDLEKHPSAVIKLRPELGDAGKDASMNNGSGNPNFQNKVPSHFEGGLVQRGSYY